MRTYGSLFSGVGGFDMGFDRAGFRCAWQVEIDPHATSVLRRHWPDVPKFSDVRDVGKHNLEPVDGIIFGSPCTDLSVAGKRAGLAGAASGLFFDAIRIIRELRPAWALWENVAGALSSNGGRDFGAALDALADSGAVAIGWRLLDAQFFGVAQRRRRVFTLASFGDGPDPAAVLFEPESVRRDSQASRAAREDLAGTIGNRIGRSHTELDGHGDYVAMPPLTARGGKGCDSDANGVIVASTVRACDRNARPDGSDNLVVTAASLTASAGHHGHSSPRGDGSDNLVIADTLRSHARPVSNSVGALAFDNHDGASAENAATLRATEHGALPMVFTERGRDGGRNVETQTDLAYAVRNGSAGSGSHLQALTAESQVRRLTPRECERLQGWPDDHTRWDDQGAEIADTHRYRMIGNGVATPVAEWIARRILTTEEHTR